jgi:hypothetical protein
MTFWNGMFVQEVCLGEPKETGGQGPSTRHARDFVTEAEIKFQAARGKKENCPKL